MGGEGRGDGDRRHIGYELPEEGPIEPVGAGLASSWGDDLGPKRVLPDERGRPVALLVPIPAPGGLARLLVNGLDEGTLLVVVENVDEVAMQSG